MDSFRAIPKISASISAMIAKGEAHLAKIVRSYGDGTADVRLWDNSVGRFPVTNTGLPADQPGVLIPVAGGSKIFLPLGLHIPRAASNVSTPSLVLSTANNTIISTMPATISGLVPGREYTVMATTDMQLGTSSQVGQAYASFEAQGVTNERPLHACRIVVASGQSYVTGTITSTVSVAADSSGVITVYPAHSWISGTVTLLWVRITALVL